MTSNIEHFRQLATTWVNSRVCVLVVVVSSASLLRTYYCVRRLHYVIGDFQRIRRNLGGKRRGGGRTPFHITRHRAGLAAGPVCGGRKLHADDVHHPEVLMTQNVAVEDKVADVRPAEIDERRDTGKMDDLNSRPRVEPESY